mmetsp:Transcript_51893/g.118053  ORF Transcript_51893/g.118053 Transcript_51893/m.118053 type:complete len:251 (+) Transcript_51893:1086-1838(+)
MLAGARAPPGCCCCCSFFSLNRLASSFLASSSLVWLSNIFLRASTLGAKVATVAGWAAPRAGSLVVRLGSVAPWAGVAACCPGAGAGAWAEDAEPAPAAGGLVATSPFPAAKAAFFFCAAASRRLYNASSCCVFSYLAASGVVNLVDGRGLLVLTAAPSETTSVEPLFFFSDRFTRLASHSSLCKLYSFRAAVASSMEQWVPVWSVSFSQCETRVDKEGVILYFGILPFTNLRLCFCSMSCCQPWGRSPR